MGASTLAHTDEELCMATHRDRRIDPNLRRFKRSEAWGDRE